MAAPTSHSGRYKKQHAYVWESHFNHRQSRVYMSEDGKGLESPPDTNPTTEIIIRNFIDNECGYDIHRYLYRKRRLEEFLQKGNIEALKNNSNDHSKSMVFMDDRNNSTVTERHLEGQCRKSRRALTASSFYHELLRNRIGLADDVDAERRLIYIIDLDSHSALALAATASRFQARFLRDFMHKHLAFQTYIGVQLPSRGWPTYCLSANIPYYAWRRNSPNGLKSRSQFAGKRRPLQCSEEVIHLPKENVQDKGEKKVNGKKDYIHDARISIMVTGLDDWFWTAYGFDDCYFQDIKHDDDCAINSDQVVHPILCGCLSNPSIRMDPILCGKISLNTPIWDPRHYFLLSLSFRMDEVKEEWDNTVSQLLEEIEPCIYFYTRGEIDGGRITGLSITQEKGFKWAIRALRQFEHQLAKTIESWNKFKRADLRHFKITGSESFEQPSWGALVDDISNHVLELENHRSSLQHWTELLEDMTNSIVTHAAHAETIIQRLQGQFIQTLTIVTIIFLPPSLASTVFSMQSTVFNNATFKNWILTLIGLSLATAMLVAAIMLINLPQATNMWLLLRTVVNGIFQRCQNIIQRRRLFLKGWATLDREDSNGSINEQELDDLRGSSESKSVGEV